MQHDPDSDQTDTTRPGPALDRANHRTVPHDLRAASFRHGYVLTQCRDEPQAERAAAALLDAGFDRDQIVLVSEDVHTLHTGGASRATLEVLNPARMEESTVGSAGAYVGTMGGALLGLLAAFLAYAGSDSMAIALVVGALVGAPLGAIVGVLVFRRVRRKPLEIYDERHLHGAEVIVGVGLRSADDRTTYPRVRDALEPLGLNVAEYPE